MYPTKTEDLEFGGERKFEKLEAKEILEFADNARYKSDEEIKDFFVRYKKEKPFMSEETKKFLRKRWDVFEFLQMLDNNF